MALNNLGLALAEVRRFDEAITACQDAAAIHQETGDEYNESAALQNLQKARAAQQAGDVTNTASGGTQHGPVLQGRDFTGLTFTTAPPPPPPASGPKT